MTKQDSVDLSDIEKLAKMSRLIHRLMNEWKLSDEKKRKLLGLSPRERKTLATIAAGEPLMNPELIGTVSKILAIHHQLKRIYGDDWDRLFGWVHEENSDIGLLKPIDIMISTNKYGLDYMLRYCEVRAQQFEEFDTKQWTKENVRKK